MNFIEQLWNFYHNISWNQLRSKNVNKQAAMTSHIPELSTQSAKENNERKGGKASDLWKLGPNIPVLVFVMPQERMWYFTERYKLLEQWKPELTVVRYMYMYIQVR